MNRLFKLTVIALMFVTSNIIAQEFQGVATYKSHRKVDVKLDSTQMGSEMHQRMLSMLKKQFEKTYILKFDKEESLYKEEEQLESPQPAGMQIVVANIGGSDILYKNTKEQRFTNQNEIMGKVFLIKDDIEKQEWVLSEETKNIGEYKCFKATMKREREVFQSGISVNGDRDLNAETEPEMEEITVTAWYTTQIPVNNGPGSYQGLPGLILEVNDGTETIICSKIVINPKNKISISEPEKGKVVNQEKFDEIMEQKMKEMNDRYSSERNDGQNIEIRIGG